MNNQSDSPSFTKTTNSVSTKTTNGINKSNIPEIYGYNVITDQDHDILNQGTPEHIHRYFDKKQKEREFTEMGFEDKLYLVTKNTIPTHVGYSINSVSFIVRFLIFIIVVWILCDFVRKN